MNAKFGATSTSDDVLAGLELKGKRVLVTGTSSGLGIETARALVAHGAYVVGAARDLDKAYATTGTVRAAAATSGGFELIEVDLGSLASVRACANKLLLRAEPFDAVIANAGVMATLHGQRPRCPYDRIDANGIRVSLRIVGVTRQPVAFCEVLCAHDGR